MESSVDIITSSALIESDSEGEREVRGKLRGKEENAEGDYGIAQLE